MLSCRTVFHLCIFFAVFAFLHFFFFAGLSTTAVAAISAVGGLLLGALSTGLLCQLRVKRLRPPITKVLSTSDPRLVPRTELAPRPVSRMPVDLNNAPGTPGGLGPQIMYEMVSSDNPDYYNATVIPNQSTLHSELSHA